MLVSCFHFQWARIERYIQNLSHRQIRGSPARNGSSTTNVQISSLRSFIKRLVQMNPPTAIHLRSFNGRCEPTRVGTEEWAYFRKRWWGHYFSHEFCRIGCATTNVVFMMKLKFCLLWSSCWEELGRLNDYEYKQLFEKQYCMIWSGAN